MHIVLKLLKSPIPVGCCKSSFLCDCRGFFSMESATKTLSYIPQLCNSNVRVVEIPSAGHFLFYDNPIAVYQAMGYFVHA